jgi:hypothetical protein
MTLLEALRDSNLFARFFRGASWGPWKAFLAALSADAGAPEADLELYRQLTGRDAWPAAAFTEAVLIVGRRGGKSRILALIAVFLACFRDYGPYLAPGEVATVAILAADRSQARVIFRFVLGLIEATPLLAPLILRRDAEQIVLSNRVVIEITTASFRATRGYSYAAVLADEVAFWRSDETSANPDTEIMRALRPGLASIPGSMLLIASSPYAKRGELYNAFRRYYGREAARVLVWKADTATMNASIDPAIIAEAYESDPESARAEYGAEFRDDLSDYITFDQLARVIMWGRSELPPEPGVTYAAFCDPSGGVSDAMTLAIGHLGLAGAGGAVCILDAVLEVRPPFDPESAVRQCADLLRRYGVAAVTGDRYAGLWPVARFREHGIAFEQSARAKSDLYGDLLSLLNTAGRVELLDLPRLAAQLCGLERRTARSGKDSIDHAPGGHDDVANSVAGLLVGLDLDRRPAMVRLEDVTGPRGEGVEPGACQYVFMLIVDAGPDIAVVYCGSSHPEHLQHDGLSLYVLDVDVLYLQPGLFGRLAGRLWDLRLKHHAAREAIFAPERLAAQLARIGVGAEPLPKAFDPEQYLALASECIGRGKVRFGPAVVEKMKTEAIGAALALRAADPIETALRSALVTAICMKFASELTG